MQEIIDFIRENDLNFKTKTELSKFVSEAMNIDFTNAYGNIEQLCMKGDLVQTGDNGKLALPEKLGLHRARLSGNSRGFGFAKLLDEVDIPDVFIPPTNMKNALHQDEVLIKIYKKSDKTEGEIIKVTKRKDTNIVGVIDIVNEHLAFVKPDEQKYGKDIYIKNLKEFNVTKGQKVVCKITKYNNGDKNPQGVLTEILGTNGDPKIEMLAIIRDNNLYQEFEPEVLAQAKGVPQTVNEGLKKHRRDFTKDNIVTIDGKDTRDIDDAVGIVGNPDGSFTLSVHIADVSHYVKEGSPLDQEAYKRGTSVYFPDLVYPMLPKELSNGICSLNPKVERLTLSVIMQISPDGDVVDAEICEGLIKSREQMNYDDVFAILNDEPEVCAKYKDLVQDFKLMQKLHRILWAKRKNRGALEFDLPECKFEMDDAGHVINVKLFERNEAHLIIESFMLLANETVAEKCFNAEIPFAYRVHEQPDGQKMFDFFQFVSGFGYKVSNNPDKITPKELQHLLLKVDGLPCAPMINAVCLRSLQKARYAPQNLGHFGIAATNYCHFTSPIRRYPDLLIHRIIKDIYLKHGTANQVAHYNDFVEMACPQCSEREKLAESAEREVDDLKKADYMQNHIGEEYEGIITGVTNFGIFVQLPNTVEGLVSNENLPNDSYTLIEKLFKLVGGKHSYQLGQTVTVSVMSVNLKKREIDFKIIEK